MSATLTRTVSVANPTGLHARPAMRFVEVAKGFSCAVTVRKGEQRVDGKSIMEMLMLAAAFGTELVVECDGDDAEVAIDALATLLAADHEAETG